MKSFGATLVLALVMFSSILEIVSGCDCDYHSGGCVISSAPSQGHKCKCRYTGAWTCRGVELQCDAGQSCPGNCRSHACCQTGGGDCDGY